MIKANRPCFNKTAPVVHVSAYFIYIFFTGQLSKKNCPKSLLDNKRAQNLGRKNSTRYLLPVQICFGFVRIAAIFVQTTIA